MFFQHSILLALAALAIVAAAEIQDDARNLANNDSSLSVVKFLAMGDGPFGRSERLDLPEIVSGQDKRHDFYIHLGDTKEREVDCDLTHLDSVAETLLQHSAVPTFVLPGEADWYNCNDQEAAWAHWTSLFWKFQNNWNHEFSTLRYQQDRSENFSFVYKGVLFVSFHVLSASVRDWDVWNEIVHDSTIWLESELVGRAFSDDVGAIVLMAHAQPHQRRFREFYDSLVQFSARIDDKPMLYIHGDEHEFDIDGGYLETPNLTRVGIGRLGLEAPLEVTVDPFGVVPFKFQRKESTV